LNPKQECQTDTKYARICGKFNGNDNIFWEQDIRLGEQIPLIQFKNNARAIIQECLWDFLVIELGRDMRPTNIFTQFDKTG